jgi:hypothetical protein
MALIKAARAAPAATGDGPQIDRLGGSIETNNQHFLTGKASPIRGRDWWAREAEREGFDWRGVLSLALDIIETRMPDTFESDFERACRQADWRHRQSRPTRRITTLRVPQTTIEAVLQCVRERGLNALREPANQIHLRAIDKDHAAKKLLNERIAKLSAGAAHAA